MVEMYLEELVSYIMDLFPFTNAVLCGTKTCAGYVLPLLEVIVSHSFKKFSITHVLQSFFFVSWQILYTHSVYCVLAKIKCIKRS